MPNDAYSREQERQKQENQEQSPTISTQPVEMPDQRRVPYSEFGGLSQALEERKQRAAQRKEAALRDWNKALEEQQSARIALVNAARPRDTSTEQRKLRNLAYGQAIGEFLGSLFGGIYGLGSSSGRGYVAKMPGMYAGTMKRIQELEDNDIIAGEKFRNLMASIRERNASDRAAAAQAGYEAADKDDRAADELLYKALLSSRQARDRAALAEQQAKWRRDLAEYNAGARKELEGHKSQNRMREKGIYGTGRDDDVAYLTKLLLPRTRTSTTNGGKFPTTTVRDATSYNKQEVAAAAALAKQIAPLVRRFNLSDTDVIALRDYTQKYPISWGEIETALSEGISVDELLEYLSTIK